MTETLLAIPATAPAALVIEKEISDTISMTLLTAAFKATVAVVKTCKTAWESPLRTSAALAIAVRTTCKVVTKTTTRPLTASMTALVAFATVATTVAATACTVLTNSIAAAETPARGSRNGFDDSSNNFRGLVEFFKSDFNQLCSSL